jgi:hypothetical protein
MKLIRSDAFNSTPYDFGWKVRDSWLGNVDSGLNPVRDEIIPYMEIEAARILRATETIIGCQDEPNRLQDPEVWRRWWMNEAHHLSTHSGSTPDADYRLPDVSRHAINVMNSASELRVAMESKDVERTALFAILLAMEALQGGYSMEFDAAKEENESRLKKQANVYAKSIGIENADQNRARQACIKKAGELWKDNPSLLIGSVAKKLNQLLLENFDKLPTLDLVPKPDTIKGWLKNAAKEGKLKIPEGAQKRGRPAIKVK